MNKCIYIFFVLFILVSCDKEIIDIDRYININVLNQESRNGISDLETLKSKSFFLFIDQKGNSLDYKIEVYYDEEQDKWLYRSLDGRDINLLWLDEPTEEYLKTVTVAAIFYDNDMDMLEKDKLFSDDFEYKIPDASGKCSDILYASTKLMDSIFFNENGEINIRFVHLLGRIGIMPVTGIRKDTMKIGGVSNIFKWHINENKIIPLSEIEYSLSIKQDIQYVYIVPGYEKLYLEISPYRWIFDKEILPGSTYLIDVNNDMVQ